MSGVLNALGLSAIAAYLLWKPVAVVALWAGAKTWVERFVLRERQVAAAALALFFCSPVAALVGWTGWGGLDTRFDFDFLSGELTTNNYLWGYLFTAIAVGLMPLGMLAHERGRTGWAAAAGPRGRVAPAVAGRDLPAGDLRPAELIARAARWCGRGGRRRATAAPLSTTSLLSRLDDAWRLAGEANDFGLGRGG